RFAEPIDLLHGRVDAGADPHAAEFWVDDRGDEDVLPPPEVIRQLARVHSGDLDVGDPAGLPRLQAGMEAHPFMPREAQGPAVAQIPEASGLARRADPFVKGQSL